MYSTLRGDIVFKVDKTKRSLQKCDLISKLNRLSIIKHLTDFQNAESKGRGKKFPGSIFQSRISCKTYLFEKQKYPVSNRTVFFRMVAVTAVTYII